ncbi:MAG: ATPase, T2SS/T4P/T4SS family [Pirellulales bacterium]
MTSSTPDLDFGSLNPASDSYATVVLDRLMAAAGQVGASDVHIEQSSGRIILRWRVQGQLVELARIPDGKVAQVLSRIKALARMVSYRSDVPQEGRMTLTTSRGTLEARVGTIPLVHGERAVIRLAGKQAADWLPEDLGLTPKALSRLRRVLQQSSGVILISGPAGSGKTTTAYACLRHLLSSHGPLRSLVSLEDPVESELYGVAQSQISITTGYSWSDGLKAVLRQDPEVLLVGEIRDDETARVVFQAAMTGQLVISTMHARTTADALRRLVDMQVPVHHIRSALDFLICQKLIITDQVDSTANSSPRTGDDKPRFGRKLQIEILPPIEGELSQALINNVGSREIELIAKRLADEEE